MKKFLSIFFALIISLTTMVMFGCGKDNDEEINDYKYDYFAYEKFNEISTAKYLTPGLDDDFIPQGMDYWDEKDLILISGYYKENNNAHPSSVIYTIKGDNGKIVNKFIIKNIDGSYHTSHAGGVAVTNKNVFIANGKYIYRISLNQLVDAQANDLLQINEKIQVPVRASYCNFSNGILWVGDFFVNGKAEHELTERPLVEGKHKPLPWTVGYILDNTDSEITFDSTTESMGATPDYVLLTGESIQGFTIYNNKVVLSKSYNRKDNSTIMVFKNPLDGANSSTVKLNNVDVPVYELSRITNYTTMPLSEGICVRDNKVLVLFESGAKFFKEDGAVNPTEHIWEMIIPN